MFAGGFDFPFPAVDGFHRGGVDVDASGEVFFEDGAGDFAGFGEGGAGYEDQAELGGEGHGIQGKIVADFDLGGEGRRKKITQRSVRTQSTQRRGEGRRSLVALDRKSPPFAQNAKDGAPSSIFVGRRDKEGRGSPAPTMLREVTVECGDYGYYTDGVAD